MSQSEMDLSKFAYGSHDHITLLERHHHSKPRFPPSVSDLRSFDQEWNRLASLFEAYTRLAPADKAEHFAALTRQANGSLVRITKMVFAGESSLYTKFAALESMRKILHALASAFLWCRAGANPAASIMSQHMSACLGSAEMNKVFATLATWQMDEMIFQDNGAWLEDLGVLAEIPEVGIVWGEVKRIWQVLCARKGVVLQEKEAEQARERELMKIKGVRGRPW